MRISALLLIIFVSFTAEGQNMVLNPSFEEYTLCPDNGGQIDYLLNISNPTWQSGSTPDFFSTCGSLGYDLPSSIYGGVYAHSGNNCVGIATYSPNTDAREYIQMELSTPLLQGENYNISFFVALADSINYSAYNFGAYLSNSLIDTNTFFNLYRLPQINNTNNLLNQRLVWTEIQGTYLASGGERYIILGNFNDNASTNPTFLGGASWGNWAFYLIDDVAVEMDSTNNVNELISGGLEIFSLPNNNLQIKINSLGEKRLLIYNSLGKKISEINFIENKHEIDALQYPNGIYFIHLKTQNYNYIEKIIIRN